MKLIIDYNSNELVNNHLKKKKFPYNQSVFYLTQNVVLVFILNFQTLN